MKFLLSSALFLAVLSVPNCAKQSEKHSQPALSASNEAVVLPKIAHPPHFNDYWYAGLAEICTYDVEQERYGEPRKAEQVFVFVTEDLSKSKQVKLDDPASAGADCVPVLKLNAIRRFHTGIYDYSLMQSVFTPVDGAPTLKSTATVQDWCGHVFVQQNLLDQGYRTRVFSYFESEGDEDTQLPLALLEDELWNRVRLGAEKSVPAGKISVIPSSLYSRLRHEPIVVENAKIQYGTAGNTTTLVLSYANIPRLLRIRFESEFPHRILGWEESVGGKTVSKGALKASRRSAYWAEHDNVHAPLRDSLRLHF